MNLRALLAAAVLLPAGSSFAQATCVVADFDRTCAGATLTFCDATNDAGAAQPPVTNTIDCATIAGAASVGVTCGDSTCSGPGCGDPQGCIGGSAGATCIGESVFYVDDAAAQENFLALQCTAGFACETTVSEGADGFTIADSCVASAETCTAAAARCDGQIAVTCYSVVDPAADALVLGMPTRQDCATFPAGSTCSVDNTNAAAPFAFCDIPAPAEGEGEGEGEGGAEGEGEGNDRDDEPEPAPGGGCLAFGVLPAFGPLALGLLALRRRRR